MFFLLLSTFLILFITFLYIVDYRSRKHVEKFKNIPEPPSIRIVGNIYHFLHDDVASLQQIVLNFFDEYGDTYKIWCAWQYSVLTCSPKVTEEILSSNNRYMEKNFLYDLLKPWLNEGLLLSVDHKWHSRRKILTPAFHFKILESFVPVFERQGDILIERIKKLNLNEDDIFDIHELIAMITLNAIAETSMGIKVDDDNVYTEAVKAMSNTIANRFIKQHRRIDFLCFFTRNDLLKDYYKWLKILHKYTEKTIVERRALLENSVIENGFSIESSDDNENLGQKKRMVFLDVLLQSTIDGKLLTNADIREEVDTFMFEGHDTTSAGLCFTLHAISRHQDIQDKIFNEIIEVIGKDKKKSIGYRELQDLKYLELVIKESLRMYPPVSVIGRKITTDSVIDGKFFPKGTELILYLEKLMRNPEIFPDPDKFIPERHCSNNYTEINPYAYVPFSAGPRNCIGQKYAMLEMKMIIVKVLQNFELLPNGPDVIPVNIIILKSTSGFHMGFRERNYK
ncbi:cytochrome P450 4d8-like [Condylostylus longicornis]|uniref:cytochrome P450 4d8-like n=1 Tax=Condylostylus longicornis TaxID=2530218 RepID=UPI00244E0718|nr:cytochrome P450 4d8-like [Condylostylus longicornis]